ncbi:MAG TPA: LLM class flavin-dependent oxidoreductase [Burkholderiales bacterium]|nr:LLM class flavin-dependent oxidoreductase [Burkholderiales bacterium]
MSAAARTATRVRLGVLDQSPVISGHTPAQAIRETVALAEAAERLGYSRYWLAEHHAIAALADPCPEILLARIAAATRHIRVGTGGVLLPYYSALKVAEVFRMLEALFPGRIDLGLGRAPGGDQLTAQALSRGHYTFADDFPEQVRDLVGFLDACLPATHPFARVKAMPAGETAPEIWLLGSSDYSGGLAALLGLRFAFAHFITAQGGDAVMQAYKSEFLPSAREDAPHSLLCVFAICAETGAEADRLAKSIDLRRLHMALGVDAPVPTYAEAAARKFDEREAAYVRSQRARLVLGDPVTVRARLLELAERYAADELMIITITGDYPSRRRSYELIADAFELVR